MNDNIYKYSKDNAIAFLLLVVISTVVIFTPAFTIQYIGLDLAFSFVFITEILISTSFYIFYLRRIPGCKITIKTNAKTLKLLVISFAVIALMQLLIFSYRDNLNNSESTSLNWIEIFILVLIVPYYEEIVYRTCLFGLLCATYKKELFTPCVCTSLFFCLMHPQYYNVADQIILFIMSMLLLNIRICSKGIFYPMLLHAGINGFVILLNML
ncbi:CPBP family intramembrane metalloprotease [Escherichia coli]|nr:CPBP family intramembrane metalloprotease [Escherichia coli]